MRCLARAAVDASAPDMRPALWIDAPRLGRAHLRHAELLLLARHLDLTLAMCGWVGSSEVLVEQATAAHRLDPSIALLFGQRCLGHAARKQHFMMEALTVSS